MIGERVTDSRQPGEIVEREQFGAQPVVDVVGVVGDVVGDRGRLRLGPGVAPQHEIGSGRFERQRRRQSALSVAADRALAAIGERAVVLDQAFEGFPREIEPVELRVAPLDQGDDAQGLGVVVEAAVVVEALVERALAGVAERRMAEVVRERQRLRQILVEP